MKDRAPKSSPRRRSRTESPKGRDEARLKGRSSGGPLTSRRSLAGGLLAITLVAAGAALLMIWRGGGLRGRGGPLGTLPSGVAPSDLNLVVVTLDTTRADRIGCYGAKQVATPNLDGLAARGVLFETAVSPMPLTLPAHCSLFTGQLPGAHTVRDNGGFKLPPESVTLAEVLQGHGYKTGGFVAAYVLDHKWGIAQGFDRYFDDFDLSKQKSVSMGDIQRRGDEVVAKAQEWLDGVAGRGRFFAWIHLYDPHAPYEPPEPFASRYAGRPYDGEIAWTDSLVGRILAGLERLGLSGRTIVAVLADHGESLGEHGEHGHGFFVYEQVTHIPFILAGPYSSLAGRRVSEVVRTVDVAPTLLEMMGLAGALKGQGRSLVPAIADAERTLVPGGAMTEDSDHAGAEMVSNEAGGRVVLDNAVVNVTSHHVAAGTSSDHAGAALVPARLDGRRPVAVTTASIEEDLRRSRGYSESYYARFHFGWSELRAIRTRRWHFIEAPRPELYDVERDPAERYNLASSETEVVGKLREALAACERESVPLKPVKNVAAPVEEDEETVRKLAALGYVGGVAPSDKGASWKDLPDPKDRIRIYNLMNRAREEIQAEREEAATDLLHEVLREAPEVIDAYFMLGNIQFKKHDWKTAADYYRRTLEKRPDHDYAMIGLADTLVATGRVDDAVIGYKRFLEQDPDNAQITYRLAQVLLDDGRNDEAESFFRATLRAEPRTARAEVGLAVVAFRRKDLAGSRQAIERALAIDPKARHAHFNLALLLEESGDARGAADAYRAEIESYPTDPKPHFNLGRLLGRMGDRTAEVAELRRATELSPEFATGHFFLAQALLAAGDLEGARKEAVRGLALDSESSFAPLGHYVLADVLSRQGRARESETEARLGRALEARHRSRAPGGPPSNAQVPVPPSD